MGQELITGFNGLLGGYKTRGVGISYPLPERNRQLIIFMTKKRQYLFTLRLLHLHSKKGNKIGPLKLHEMPKFEQSPIQWKIIEAERKTLPDWYKSSPCLLA